MSNNGTRVKKVLIVGAGPAGLCAHLALRQQGFEVEHFERNDSLAGAGASFAIWPNGVRLLTALGLRDELEEIGFAARRFYTYDNKGEFIGEASFEGMPERAGAPMFIVTRGDLQRVFGQAIGQENIRLGTGVAKADNRADGVTLTLEDGSTVDGDLLICADGIRSPLRRELIDPIETQPLGITDVTGYIPDDGFLDKYSPKQDGFVEHWAPALRALVMPLENGKLGWGFSIGNKDHLKPDDWIAYCREAYRDFPEMYHVLLDRLEEEGHSITTWNIYDVAPLSRWWAGRAIAIGDSAHATSPYLGQGANQSMEDGYLLAKLLRESAGTVEEVLTDFEATRRPRAEKVVSESAQLASVLYEPDPIKWQQTVDAARKSPEYSAVAGVEGLIAGGPIPWTGA